MKIRLTRVNDPWHGFHIVSERTERTVERITGVWPAAA
jgi:hypothetical protein